ncbi:sugar transferase [uncultured Parasphingorhabdus sp.]|uniref:sugar transferase n=1 Tax=uncultured Parasphingorhabdus sp. TaxID=2709694 RepID=UPI0030D85B98
MQRLTTTKMRSVNSYPFSTRKRVFDITLAVFASIVLIIPIILLALCVKLTSSGPVFFSSDRVGQNNVIFRMVKFRTMREGTPIVATDKLASPANWITPLGRFMRRTSLDELPQLLNVLVGDMSIVGPRPALFNQEDLIQERTARGIDALLPGITGFAQISGRDELSIPHKVEADAEYLSLCSFWMDMKIILITAWQVIAPRGVQH